MTLADRDAALERGDRMWDELRDVLDAHLHEPIGPATDWTGHDVYAHFARWQEQTIMSVGALRSGHAPAVIEGTEEEINERWRAHDGAADTSAIQQRCIDTRAELRALMAALTEEEWSAWGCRSFDDIDGSHYAHHLAAARSTP